MSLTLIFDFDGTLCDSFESSVRIMNELAPKFGYNVIAETAFDSLKDMSFPEFKKALGIAGYKIPCVLYFGRKRMRRRIEELHPIPGLAEALLELKALGVRLGVLSSNSETNVRAFLTRHEIDVFEFVHGGSGLFGKTRVLKKLMRRYGILANELAYVGDEARDVRAAKAAGVKALAVLWGFNTLRLLRETKPDAIVSHPNELVKWSSGLAPTTPRKKQGT